jgi:hypothetical protein
MPRIAKPHPNRELIIFHLFLRVQKIFLMDFVEKNQVGGVINTYETLKKPITSLSRIRWGVKGWGVENSNRVSFQCNSWNRNLNTRFCVHDARRAWERGLPRPPLMVFYVPFCLVSLRCTLRCARGSDSKSAPDRPPPDRNRHK